VDHGDFPVIVLADAGLIEQVLMNLVANAKDAMPEGGQLSIGTGLAEMDSEFVRANGYGRPGKYALITVSDTGVGMDEEIRKRIFEPFFTTKEVGRGTGLGLAISYGIVKQHDGYIKVYSEPGHGTTFNIYLPFMEGARPDAPAPKRQAAAAARIMDGSETILVAEDDTAVRELTARVLESRGYTVIAARDGVEAMAEFMAHREGIDLLLLDMIMPRKNGKEVAEEIRKAKPLIRVLLASGYTDSIVPAAELTAAGFAFIHKPFQSKELLGKVREVLDGP
jgi:CheY-like chemotaxis protein